MLKGECVREEDVRGGARGDDVRGSYIERMLEGSGVRGDSIREGEVLDRMML